MLHRPMARVLPRPAVAVLLSALLVGGCSADTPAPAPLEAATVTLMQYTHDQVNRQLVVNVSAGSETVRLERVEVVSGAFTGTGPRGYLATVPAGDTLDLRVPLGDPDCSVRLAAEDVTVEFDVPDQEPVAVSPAGADFLAELHRQECAAKEAVDRVPVSWGQRWRTSGSGRSLQLVAPLRIGPVGASHARLTGLDGSVIFVPEVDDLPLELSRGGRRTIPVTFRPNRCDAHVWETSRGFQFELRMTIGDGTEVRVPVVPPRAKQQLLTRAWQEQCGVNPGQ